MFVADPVEGGITYDSNGIVSVPDTPGLGATIDIEYLSSLKMAVRI
jgi:L-alanine-DL-glutamate epimerase-like enolase superfamily enzyme